MKSLSLIVLIVVHISRVRSQQVLRISPNGESVNQPANQQFVVTCKGDGAEPNWFSNLKWFDPRNEEITATYTKLKNPEIRVEELSVGKSLLLHFLRPVPDNTGLYTCRGTFQHSDSLEAKIQINFFQDVTWEDCPEIQALVKGNSGERIRCKASAHPKPNIVWMKEGVTLEGVSRYNIDSNGIRINDAVNESDGGLFRVRALVTETGRLHDKYITVQVFVRPKILQTFPEQLEATEGEQSILECKANGSPEPVYSWFDQNRRNLSTLGGYTVDRNSGILMILKVRKFEDNGLFTCIAENTAGRDEKSTQMLVMIRPEIRSFQNQSFDENKDSRLECRAIGDPRPKISIRKDGNSRAFQTGDARVSFEQTVEDLETVLKLTIYKTERNDDGLYFCRAENKGGIVERVGHLEVRFSPDLSRSPLTQVKTWDLNPINVTCIADAIPNATIKWFYRGQELYNGFNSAFKIQDNNAGVSQLFINPLSSSGNREIYGVYKCEAINSLGRRELNIVVDKAFKPGAIMEVLHDRITSTTITFRLFAPAIDGGLPVKKIHVQYREDDKPWETMRTRTWPMTTTGHVSTGQASTYFLDNLKPRTRYIFRFAAENDVGIGDFSADKVLLTERESRPEAPKFHNLPLDTVSREIVSQFSDKFIASWNLPPNNGREIRYFELKYYPVIKTENGFEPQGYGNEKLESVSIDDEVMTSYTLKKLKSNTYYRIELRAKNDLGFSETESVVFRTSASIGAEDDMQDMDDIGNSDSSSALKTSSLGAIIGIVITIICICLVVMDVFFFIHYKVGAIYFLRTHVCSQSESKERAEDDQTDQPMRHENEAIDNPAFDIRFSKNMGKKKEKQNFLKPPKKRTKDSAV